LQIYGVDPKNIYARLDSLETRMNQLEQRMNALESRMNQLEQRMSAIENRMTTLENRVTVVEGDLNTLNTNLGTFYRDIVLENGFNTLTEYLMDWRAKFDVIENYLGDFWDALNLYSYDSAQNTLYYSDLESWMGAVKQMLRVSFNREQANQDGLNSLTTTVNGHTTSIANLFAADAAMTTRINTNEQNIQNNANTITSHGNRIAALEITVSQHGNTLTNHESRINKVETAVDNSYTSSAGDTYDIYDAFDKIFNDSAHLVMCIGGAELAINRLGHESLGPNYQGTNGNGVTLLNVYNKVNEVISVTNTLSSGGTVLGSISSLPGTSVFTSWTDVDIT
jgi:predicted  nucleic acid-binding Zn-ribbon protein